MPDRSTSFSSGSLLRYSRLLWIRNREARRGCNVVRRTQARAAGVSLPGVMIVGRVRAIPDTLCFEFGTLSEARRSHSP
jgi:hypothetical protein